MSFDAILTLKNRLAADITFVKLTDDSSKAVYTRTDSAVGLPTTFQIAHTMSNPGAKGNDKHLVKLTRVTQGASGTVNVDTLNLSSSVAREGYSQEAWLDLYAMLTSFLVEANIIKLNRGEN